LKRSETLFRVRFAEHVRVFRLHFLYFCISTFLNFAHFPARIVFEAFGKPCTCSMIFGRGKFRVLRLHFFNFCISVFCLHFILARTMELSSSRVLSIFKACFFISAFLYYPKLCSSFSQRSWKLWKPCSCSLLR
jgi:hypothetical protein